MTTFKSGTVVRLIGVPGSVYYVGNRDPRISDYFCPLHKFDSTSDITYVAANQLQRTRIPDNVCVNTYTDFRCDGSVLLRQVGFFRDGPLAFAQIRSYQVRLRCTRRLRDQMKCEYVVVQADDPIPDEAPVSYLLRLDSIRAAMRLNWLRDRARNVHGLADLPFYDLAHDHERLGK